MFQPVVLQPTKHKRQLFFSIAILAWFVFPLLLRAAAPKPIQQTYVGYVSYNRYVEKKPWDPIKVGGVTIKVADVEDEIVVSGMDKRGRPWSVYVPTAGGLGYSTAWTADVDGDGTKDFIFVHSYPVNGHCAAFSEALTFILFDAEGKPVPASFNGQYEQDYSFDPEGGKGLLDLGNWGASKDAQLVEVNCYYYDLRGPQGGGPYGLTDVYEAHGGVWRKLSKKDRAPHEATYISVARQDERDLYPQSRIQKTFMPDYSTDRAAAPTKRIVRREPDIALDDGQSCSGPPGIVLYSPKETVAVLEGKASGWDNIDDRWTSLLKQIFDQKIPVQLTGQLEEGICSPALIWATKQ